MKEWILRYAEQQNEEEKSETSKSLEEEKFDPVSRNLYWASSWIYLAKYLTFIRLSFFICKLRKQLPLGVYVRIK